MPAVGEHQHKRNLRFIWVVLFPITYKIWQRYKGQLPVPGNQTMNGVIKQLTSPAP